jgi:hypothetical protein
MTDSASANAIVLMSALSDCRESSRNGSNKFDHAVLRFNWRGH